MLQETTGRTSVVGGYRIGSAKGVFFSGFAGVWDVVLRLHSNLQAAHGKQADEAIPTPDAETSDKRFDNYSHNFIGHWSFDRVAWLVVV